MVRSPCRRPLAAATRKRRPKTNCTTVAGASIQTLMRSIGHGAPPGQRETAIMARPMRGRQQGVPQQRLDARVARAASASSAASTPRRRGRRHLVAGRLDGRHDPAAVDASGIEVHRGALGGEVDRRVRDPVGAPQERSMRVTHEAQVMPRTGSESSSRGAAAGLVIGSSGYYRGVSVEFLGDGRTRRRSHATLAPA